ncbi:hypothetical protein LOR_36c03450 [Legionella oakridgensis RV-2-2007]|nr:hypothetical protein LOR_36c03450 [Legionella oakridgensis RV-2-2007]
MAKAAVEIADITCFLGFCYELPGAGTMASYVCIGVRHYHS